MAGRNQCCDVRFDEIAVVDGVAGLVAGDGATAGDGVFSYGGSFYAWTRTTKSTAR